MSGTKLAKQRAGARLAAVQALYQMELSGALTDEVVTDFQNGKLPQGEDGALDSEADLEHFKLIVELVVQRQETIDKAIAKRLSGWRLDRLDAVARAILRAGTVELEARGDVPTPVVIDEYVEIAKAFFEGPEPGFVNATLDAVAKDLRA
ncbi:MAG: transcription antitermination factor NusB [Caulobacterales bacterium]